MIDNMSPPMYTQHQVERIAKRAAELAVHEALSPPNLDNWIGLFPEGDETMNKRIRDKVTVNGVEHWIGGYSNQDLYDAYVRLLTKEGLIEWIDDIKQVPDFGDYISLFYDTYKQSQQQNTIVNRMRIIKNHIKPKFGHVKINSIQTYDLQQWFNDLAKKYSKETLLKIKNTMSPAFDAAVEEHIIQRNPFNSKYFEIGGKETVPHKAIPADIMSAVRSGASDLPTKQKLMCGLLSYTAMRMEEVLGLRWEDISDDTIHIQRAVVHPTRNMPEIKTTKTKTSDRIIPYPDALKQLIEPHRSSGFLLTPDDDATGETPLSYSEMRRVFNKIRKHFGITEYSAHDFRDTCATEWRENGIPLDVIARLLGHAKTETTERKYVKYRQDILEEARKLM